MLGIVLKALRVTNNMSIKEAVQKLDVSSTFVAQIESGNKKIPLNTFNKYANAFNIPKSLIMAIEEKYNWLEDDHVFQNIMIDILQYYVNGINIVENNMSNNFSDADREKDKSLSWILMNHFISILFYSHRWYN